MRETYLNINIIITRLKLPLLIVSWCIGTMVVLQAREYLSPDFSRGFLLGKAAIFPWYRFFLYAHIVGAPLSLFAGICQFVLPQTGFIHRVMGYVYIASIIVLAAPGGLGMSFHALGGGASVLNFLLLTPLWVFFTWKALAAARAHKWKIHQQYMIRSFILTNSAVTLRILSFICNHYTDVSPVDSYRFNVWLSWLPLWLCYELWLFSIKNKVT